MPLLVAAACGSSSSGGGSDAPRPVDSAVGSDASSPLDAPPIDGASVGSDPANDGALAVTTTTVSIPGTANGSTIPATVFAPTGGTSPRPLVVISPGFQLARTEYTTYAHHLATWGFVVVLHDYADQSFFADHTVMAKDVGKVIDWALGQTSLAVDATKIATAGHSLGGDVSVYAAALDPRVKAVVGWDPVDGTPSVVPEHMSGFTAALAVIGETTDGSGGFMPCAPTADNFQAFYAAAPSPALAITVAHGSHMDWVDDGSCSFCTLCAQDPTSPAPPATAHTMTRRLNVAWLRTRLLGDTSLATWLDAPPEVASHAASIVTK